MTDKEDSQGGLVKGVVPPFQVPMPYCTKQRFAELSGQDIGIVEAQVDRGYIPSRKIGKHRMVNLARMWVDALNSELND